MKLYSISFKVEIGFEDIFEAIIENGFLDILGYNVEYPAKENSAIINIYNETKEKLENNFKIIKDKLDINNVNNLPITDYIIDACDDINAKVLLVKFALKNNIKIISSCGTGNRINPSLLTITNIWKTQYDPLAKKFRYMLRKEHISYKLPVVCSSEVPIIKQSGSVGSMGLVPNCCGIFLASYVINDILKK